MRKDNKYNRLTWQRKVSVNRKHPVYTKEVQREMYLGEEITVDDTWENYMDYSVYESEVGE